jgi:hypothetical protein
MNAYVMVRLQWLPRLLNEPMPHHHYCSSADY